MKRHKGFNGYSRVTLMVALTFFCLMAVLVQCQPAAASSAEEGTPSGAGMQAASAVSTILYFPFKAAFALGGGVVGGLAYAFSGGDESAAQSVWERSMYGTYAITPSHLKGDRSIHFLGEREASTPGPGPYREETYSSGRQPSGSGSFREETLK